MTDEQFVLLTAHLDRVLESTRFTIWKSIAAAVILKVAVGFGFWLRGVI